MLALPAPVDRRGRPLRDLRISVTDRCNFRCRYCMPREQVGNRIRFVPKAEILSLEEIAQVARVATALGVRKIRVTGGEPLLRGDLERLVGWLSELPVDLAMTTNGALLADRAQALSRAGLRRITVSLDALGAEAFRAMCDTDVPVEAVLEGIRAAQKAGLGPVKVNTVVRRGVNDGEILPLAERFRGTGVTVRFIEYMDVGTSNGWRMDEVVDAAEIAARIDARFPLVEVPPAHPGEVARRYRYADGRGEIGIIASVTRPFCGDCNRLRLSAEGRLFTCLFSSLGTDLRPTLRGGGGHEAIRAALTEAWTARDDHYSELRNDGKRRLPRVEMSYIGG